MFTEDLLLVMSWILL